MTTDHGAGSARDSQAAGDRGSRTRRAVQRARPPEGAERQCSGLRWRARSARRRTSSLSSACRAWLPRVPARRPRRRSSGPAPARGGHRRAGAGPRSAHPVTPVPVPGAGPTPRPVRDERSGVQLGPCSAAMLGGPLLGRRVPRPRGGRADLAGPPRASGRVGSGSGAGAGRTTGSGRVQSSDPSGATVEEGRAPPRAMEAHTVASIPPTGGPSSKGPWKSATRSTPTRRTGPRKPATSSTRGSPSRGSSAYEPLRYAPSARASCPVDPVGAA